MLDIKLPNIYLPAVFDPAGTESEVLNKLEQYDRTAKANVSAITSILQKRPLTPQEITSLINYMYAVDQHFSIYLPIGDTLSSVGRPTLSQKLTQIRQDIKQAIDKYSDMYQSAVQHGYNLNAIQQEAAVQANNTLLDATMHTAAIYEQLNRQQALLNEGASYWDAVFLSQRK